MLEEQTYYGDEQQQQAPPSPEEIKEREAVAAEGLASLDAVVKATEARQLTPELAEFEMHARLAKVFSASGLFGMKGVPPRQSIAAAFAKIEIGKTMGFGPAQSMMGISVVNDRPTIEASLVGARLVELGYSWDVQWIRDTTGLCVGCRLWLKFKGEPVMEAKRDDKSGEILRDNEGQPVLVQVSQSFTKVDALRIKQYAKGKLISLADKDTYRNYPENMYFARALRNLQRFKVPQALASAVASGDEAWDVIHEEKNGFTPAGSPEEALAVAEKKLKAIRKDETPAAAPTPETPITVQADQSGQQSFTDTTAAQSKPKGRI